MDTKNFLKDYYLHLLFGRPNLNLIMPHFDNVDEFAMNLIEFMKRPSNKDLIQNDDLALFKEAILQMTRRSMYKHMICNGELTLMTTRGFYAIHPTDLNDSDLCAALLNDGVEILVDVKERINLFYLEKIFKRILENGKPYRVGYNVTKFIDDDLINHALDIDVGEMIGFSDLFQSTIGFDSRSTSPDLTKAWAVLKDLDRLTSRSQFKHLTFDNEKKDVGLTMTSIFSLLNKVRSAVLQLRFAKELYCESEMDSVVRKQIEQALHFADFVNIAIASGSAAMATGSKIYSDLIALDDQDRYEQILNDLCHLIRNERINQIKKLKSKNLEQKVLQTMKGITHAIKQYEI